MQMMKRIFLFGAVNILVMITITFLLNVLGIGRYITAQGLDLTQLAIFCLVWGMVGSFVSLMLSKIMAKWSMGVQIIDPNTSSPELRDLVTTVYRYAEQAGIAKPEVGIYNSPEVNAFATGPSKSNSLVAVSTGLLNVMSRDERDGVLAHEVAHIANGDMVTLTLIQGIVNAFVMFFARIIAYAITSAMSRNDSDERGSPFVEMMIVMVLQIALGFLGSMVVAKFSRSREYRADLGGAKLAGKAQMISALQRLQMMYESPAQQNAATNDDKAIAAFKISGRQGSSLAMLFSTHPPLEDRIAKLREARQL